MDSVTVRQEVFDTYWYFAYERLMMLLRRQAGNSMLSDDPILGHYKFCNTYRVCDRVTQYLIRNVQYNASWSDEDVVLRTVLFRLFSWPSTWEEIGGESLSTATWDKSWLQSILDARYARGEKLYTHAFILSGHDAFGLGKKHKNHLSLVEKMIFEDKLPRLIIRAGSLEEIYKLLIEYPMIGRFMAYQLAIDLNYSSAINFSESSFVIAGPGALRGIDKCFESIGQYSPEEIIMYMVESQSDNFKRLGYDFPGLYGRKLQAIDCQGLFCELDKYSRVKFPELTSNRKRIKSSYRPSPEPLTLFFPPKWNINV